MRNIYHVVKEKSSFHYHLEFHCCGSVAGNEKGETDGAESTAK